MKKMLTLILFAYAISGYAGVHFTQKTYKYTLEAQKDYLLLDLFTLLSDPGSGDLEWAIVGEKPGFLVLDSEQGYLNGKPQLKDMGQYRFRLAVVDPSDESGAIATVELTVKKALVPPSDSIQLPEAMENLLYAVNLDELYQLAQPGKDSYALLTGPAWLVLSHNGLLTGTPRKTDVGHFTLVFSVTNEMGLVIQSKAFGTVFHDSQPLLWLEDPINLKAKVGALFVEKLDPFAVSPDAQHLKFEKVTGPAWLSVSASGKVWGRPQLDTLGLNTFRIRVVDSKGQTADTTLNILVE